MSSNHVDIDRAVSELRKEQPTPEVRERARNAILRGHRPKARLRPLIGGVVAAALLYVLWPRPLTGGAWAQSLQNSLSAINCHRVSVARDGQVTGEEWQSGERRAFVLYKRGKVFCEQRTDGKRLYNYFDVLSSWNPKPLPPNARQYGMIHVVPRGETLTKYELQTESLDRLLKTPGIQVLEQQTIATASGSFERYRLKTIKPYRSEFYATVDPSQGRIVEMSGINDAWKTKIDYPNSIPAQVFDPRGAALTGIEVYDIKSQDEEIANRLKSGLGQQGPVNLRLVLLDANGGLWVLWTGAPPDGKMSHPIQLPGVPSSAPYGLRAFTTSYAMDKKSRPAPAINLRLGGMAVTPWRKIGPTVDVNVPYPGGVAKFRRVPVLRTGTLEWYDKELGIH
jgi:hypothetical protein